MKAGWEVKNLDEVCARITDGSHYSPKSQAEGFPYITVRDVDDKTGLIDFKGCKFVGQGDFDDLAKNGCRPSQGDVLFSKDGTVGKVALVRSDRRFVVLSSLAILTPDRKQIAPEYLHHVLRSTSFLAEAIGKKTGVAIKRIVLKNLKRICIPLPPLEEQQRIVAVLDEAFEGLARARAHAEANLQNARELFENFLGAIFTQDDDDWFSAPLQDLVEIDCSLSYGIVQPGDDVSGGLPIVRPTDLGQRIITLDGLKKIDPVRADGYARTKLKGTEILLCVRGSTGVVAMASQELEGANVTRGIVPVRFNPEKMNHLLGYYQFLSRPVQDQIRAGTYGAALMQINIRDLRKLTFSVPPNYQQEALLERLKSVANDFDTLIKDYTRKLQSMDDLRQSLLQKAFAGELT